MLQYREKKVVLAYSLAVFFESIWISGYIFELIVSTLPLKLFWDNFQFIGTSGFSVMIIIFTLEFSQIKIEKYKIPLLIMGIFYSLLSVYVYIFPYSLLIRKNIALIDSIPFLVLTYDYGIVMWIYASIIYSLAIFLLILLIRIIIQTKRKLFRIHLLIIAFGIMFPFILSFLGSLGFLFNYQRDISPFSFGISNIFIVIGLIRYKLFDIMPIANDLIFDQINIGVCVLDDELRVVDINPQMIQILDQKINSILGKNISNVLKTEEELEIVQKTSSNWNDPYEIELNLGEKVFNLKSIPLKDKYNEYFGMLLIYNDITKSKQADKLLMEAAEFEYASQSEELKEANRKLLHSQKMDILGQLTGGIAHDFNNILTSIIGNVELALYDNQEGGSIEEYLDEINKASHFASQLTSQLLAFSRKQAISPKNININKLIIHFKNIFSRLVGDNIEIQLNLSSDIGIVQIDPGAMQQVLTNLVVNSRDALPNGGKIQISTENLEISEDSTQFGMNPSQKEFILIKFSDNGIGMTENVRSHLFEPFFTTKPQGKGTGLGLAVVYGSIRQFGGYIEVDSTIGEGTSFRIYLPRIYQLEDEIDLIPHNSDIPRGKETILLVEDNSYVRKSVFNNLVKNGYNILDYDNPLKALQTIQDTEVKFDIVLTDISMPEMNGIELGKKIREKIPNSKILYFSSSVDSSLADKLLIDHQSAFIQKPFRTEDLIWKIQSLLRS